MIEYGENERKNDFNYFVENYQKLYEQYGHKYLVIQNKTVIGSYDTEIDAINKTSEVYPLGTFIVQECNGDESAYTNYVSSWQVLSI